MVDETGLGRRRRRAHELSDPEYLGRERDVLEAAARVFAERGFHRTRLSDVAAELGLDRASLYYYVDSKEDLFERVAQEVAEGSVSAQEEIARQPTSAPERLTALMAQLMSDFWENYPALYAYIQEDVRNLAGSTSRNERMATMQVRSHAALKAIISEGQEAGELRTDLPASMLANAILEMLNAIYRWFPPDASVHSGPQKMDGRQIGMSLASMILEGFRQPRASS